jgi:hypothetical protein
MAHLQATRLLLTSGATGCGSPNRPLLTYGTCQAVVHDTSNLGYRDRCSHLGLGSYSSKFLL